MHARQVPRAPGTHGVRGPDQPTIIVLIAAIGFASAIVFLPLLLSQPLVAVASCTTMAPCGLAIALLNSNFTAALAGAGLGAWTAYWFAVRAKAKDDLVQELDSVNAAILLSAAVCNDVLVQKRDHILPMVRRYQQAEANYVVFMHLAKAQKKEGPAIHELSIDGLRFEVPADEADLVPDHRRYESWLRQPIDY